MLKWIYRWLPILCGCHCMDERSFYINNKKFPVCARCTGELAGILISLLFGFLYRLPVTAAIFLLLPMIVDGFVQALTSYNSTNARRFITGFMFGFGICTLFVISTMAALQFGIDMAHFIA